MSVDEAGDGDRLQAGRLPELEWNEITEPGCYLHLGSGLLARMFPETIRGGRHVVQTAVPNRVARLAEDPGAPLTALRLLAGRHGYLVRF
jgi:hypothetical protein